jgi:hypothetical protein
MYLHPLPTGASTTPGPPPTTSYNPCMEEAPPPHIISMDLPRKVTPTTPSRVPLNPPPHHTGQQQARVNFIQPSPIQQVQEFEQLNTTNPPHQPNNNKERERIKTKAKGETPNNQTPSWGKPKSG